LPQQAAPDERYLAPSLTVHGGLSDLTAAQLIGMFIDDNHRQGRVILGNTNL
jgi:hypothetical protein